jgi:hypothetical protein
MIVLLRLFMFYRRSGMTVRLALSRAWAGARRNP